jgi:hypothetical protein
MEDCRRGQHLEPSDRSQGPLRRASVAGADNGITCEDVAVDQVVAPKKSNIKEVWVGDFHYPFRLPFGTPSCEVGGLRGVA